MRLLKQPGALLSAPQDLATLHSENLESTGTTEIGDTTFTRLLGQNIARGTKIIINVEGLPNPNNSFLFGDTPGPAMIALIGILVILILIIIGIVSYMIIYKQLFRPTTKTLFPRPSKRQNLIESIAKLDIQFQTGSIGESQYKNNRSLLKKQLVEEIKKII